MKILHKLFLLLGSIFLLSGTLFKLLLLDTDTMIVRYGVSSYRLFSLSTTLAIVGGFLLIIAGLLLSLWLKAKTKNALRSSNTLSISATKKITDEKILQKIAELEVEADLDKEIIPYLDCLQTAKMQMKQVNEQLADLLELKEENDYDVLNKAQESLEQGKQQILTNIRNLLNRVTIKGELDLIGKD